MPRVAAQVSGLILRDLSSAVIRSNPRYRFSPVVGLSETERSYLGRDATATTFAGVLVDVESAGLRKAVSSRIATLVGELRAPVPACTVLDELAPDERDSVLIALLFDGILEIEADHGFVSEVAAYSLVIGTDEDIVGQSRLAELSVAAVKHGQRLRISNPAALAARLYFYNRVPVSSWSRSLWPDGDAVLQFLGLVPGAALRHDLTSCFEMSPRSEHAWWLSWRRREMPQGHTPASSTCKLYISAAAEHTKLAFAEVVALLSDSNALSLKIGPNAHGLLRPDKLVVYFERQADLFTFAEALRPRLTGLTAQGVPFSSPIDDAGLLSWGTDPPKAEAGFGWYADDSWRIWICNRLALALRAAMDPPAADVAPWRYALARLWLSGVDTRTWSLHQRARIRSGHEPEEHQ
jgi:hypothetical protein